MKPSYRLQECSGSAPRDVSARALHPQLRPGESLVHLVKMRASQINGCAYCLDVHSKDARALGETEQRLYVLDACEEAPFYSERERAALALTDAVHPDHGRPCARRDLRARTSAFQRTGDDCPGVYPDHHQRLEPALLITMRTEVGNYQPKARPVSQTA